MADKTRLLRCNQCRTIDALPWYEGPPDGDHLLAALIREKHTDPGGEPHIGVLMNVETQHWNSPSTREAILARIREVSGHTGLDPDFYEARDTFSEDALKCWRSHHNNPACNEYKSDRKRLTPGTAQERREAGLPEYRSPHDRYLCEFCPVHSLVLQAARHEAGLYK